MDILIPVWALQLLIEKFDNEYVQQLIKYENSNKKMDVDTMKLTANQLHFLEETLTEYYEKNVPDKNDRPVHNKFYPFLNVARKIRSAIDLEANGSADGVIRQLEAVPLAVKLFFKQFPHKYIFVKNSDGYLLPYMLTKVTYSRADRYHKAYVSFKAQAVRRGQKVEIGFTIETARRTIFSIFKDAGWYLETEDLIDKYSESYLRYSDLRVQTGQQVNLVDVAVDGYRRIAMTVDGKPTKGVIDDLSDSEEAGEIVDKSSAIIENKFFDDQDIAVPEVFSHILDGHQVDEDDTSVYSILPTHTYVKCFDLGKHRFIDIHVKNVQDYVWDHNLSDKLILDKETKDLITILVDSTRARREDIIAGKMSGTIVLATGIPGVGKTLTAEVFSEKIEKSLYVVQCSQLGIDIKSIEGNLKLVLDRASRWGSILLIDEADVYIRDRGTDIVHNAIVGVFLRLIEYYNGVLFMTSNRGDIIDDAIISRATAWIQYTSPSPSLLGEIWEVLSKQFDVTLTRKHIDQLITDIPDISGRTVRNLLKLITSLDYDSTDSKANYEHIKEVSKYQKLV